MPDKRAEQLSVQGKTVVFVSIDGILSGAIVLADIIRPESREAIFRLKHIGTRAMMLTGDKREVAK